MSSATGAVASAKTSSGSNKVAGASSAGRPSLKNLTRARVPRAGIISVGLAVVSAVAWKIFVSDRHKREVSAFYK